MAKIYVVSCDNGLPYEDNMEFHLGEFASIEEAQNAIIDNFDTINGYYAEEPDGQFITISSGEKENGMFLSAMRVEMKYVKDIQLNKWYWSK